MKPLSFMEIENDQEGDVIDDLPEIEEDQDDTTDWKTLALKNQGIAKRTQSKLKKLKLELEKVEAKPKIKEPEKTEKKQGFDYGEKAFLKASDVTPDEFPLVEEFIKETGKTLDEVLENKYFRAEQKELREQKASADAIPSGSKRSPKSSKDEVDYWLAKGELPPADQPELRREYVNKKIKIKESGSPFTSRPVVQ